MIIPDINLLVFAHNAAAPLHDAARAWWEDLLTREQPVGLPWAVTFGFLRLVTHPSVLTLPLAPAAPSTACAVVNANRPALDPGPRHLALLGRCSRAPTSRDG